MKLFKKGDLVRLKSGGPTMTVIGYFINGAGGVVNYFLGSKYPEEVETTLVNVEWFEKGKLKKGRFDQDLIEFV